MLLTYALVVVRRRVQTLVASLFVVSLVCVDAMGQDGRTYPPFTSVTRSTEYDPKGEIVRTSTSTRYESSNGDWRVVSKFGDYEQATLYRRGRGVYASNSRTTVIIKQTDHAPGCPLRTAEELRSDPKFARTEEVLGFTAYVWIDRTIKDLVIEHYWVPELGGGSPFKQVQTHSSGVKFVNEPISITLGEPAASDITGPDYVAIEQVPVFFRNLSEHLLSKPEAEYPAEVLGRGVSGVVRVQVTVDDTGRVVMAGSLTGGGQSQSLREAAVEAAYKATFKPIFVDGRPVVANGILDYPFALPK